MFGKPKYTIVKIKKKEMPDGLCTKCESCGQIIFNKQLNENMNICSKCDFHFVLGARERLQLLVDTGSFEEYDQNLKPKDVIGFKGPKTYGQKIKQDQQSTGLNDAVITGIGTLDKKKALLAITDSRFIMGSMGSVVGEKITRVTERATELDLPLIIVSGSGGGARMYEGMFSLMQMAKTSAALGRHKRKGLLYISVLTNPTMAGIMASFASLGDITIAEPKALIGFTGPRVIEQTIRQKLPEGFQRSEFLLEHGMIDFIIHRKQLKSTLVQIIDYLADK
ncbi:MAG: acetyl-CoA carboxylase, carboxyltransferase subunit beta [Candidatus Omnitrophica bacterium]|nr:acetyl-CoA carboxylase, carboxyltransferase subunit beta [Candidatus Omnitrophota bacterium]MBU4478355.1 acetyl-CoA carboxylase, carboxyltransferase subunit beta [Candidatus Omnitrophota bacterium]MCG2702842.1 acetyl-CoA carboxylase, carboxyltransferase subunit beta [Candidatus Omnitrophota bacterium]